CGAQSRARLASVRLARTLVGVRLRRWHCGIAFRADHRRRYAPPRRAAAPRRRGSAGCRDGEGARAPRRRAGVGPRVLGRGRDPHRRAGAGFADAYHPGARGALGRGARAAALRTCARAGAPHEIETGTEGPLKMATVAQPTEKLPPLIRWRFGWIFIAGIILI